MVGANGARPPFPEVWDSTMVATGRDCWQRFYLSHIRNLHPPEVNIDLHFGGCFAAGLREMRLAYYTENCPTYHDPMAALAAGCRAIITAWGGREDPHLGKDSDNKTLEACLDSLWSFMQQYPLDREAIQPLLVNGRPIVEQTFACPLPWVKHPVSGAPIVYAGRFDMLCHYAGSDAVLINDEKTTTKLGDSWNKKWRLRSQLTGYQWGCEQYGYSIAGIIIRGVGILKRSTTHAFVIEQRSNHDVALWLEQTQRDIAKAISMWAEGYWDYNLDNACSAFGGCQFLDVCTSNEPEKWLTKFSERVWNPLAREVGA